MAYTDVYDQATNTTSTLAKQTAVALHKAAVNISNEATSVTDHDQRMAWARRVFADPVSWSGKAIWKVMENATIAANPATATDNDVQFVVDGIIPQLMRLS